ncbi:MAG: DUF962 domain-containing protein [Bacteroidetes bacterium]|jgi:hypothetical protein|nr:DUF962 domain-containing protein [Bacteroidota bacterium]MBK7504903.1 DUF962 domain-containing protein [Bacteroidota bacterium]MBK9635801.1 DUF962 domain-containing protein [Bacteroidota bacterium]MBL0288021.1 DUF962 domain-containing protein [Bacteroidota bacterium]
MSERKYKTFKDFYPYYLTEHSDKTCRILHYLGTTGLIVLLVKFILEPSVLNFFLMPLCGYFFAWIGHFFFEKNKPATFQYPGFSLLSDFLMYFHFLTGQIDTKLEEAKTKIG